MKQRRLGNFVRLACMYVVIVLDLSCFTLYCSVLSLLETFLCLR